MSDPISRRDWEILSAYLDGALKNGQKDKLEARLETDKELRDTLEQLRRTRKLLRSSPQARLPRHFIITQDMLAEKGGSFWDKTLSLNLLSAVASVLLVIVILGDIGSFPLPTSMRSDSAPAEAFADAEESMELMAPAADEAIQPQADEVEKSVDADSLGETEIDGAEAGAALQGVEEPSLAAEQEANRVAEDDSAVEDATAMEVEGEPSENADMSKEEEAPTSEPTITTPPPIAQAVPESTPEPTVTSPPPIAEVVSEPTVISQDAESDVSSLPLVRTIEILLGVVALGSALLARRRRLL